uniref:Phage protein D n=1 Tax=Candidatus Kentrum sp. LFY TaxID=2126342 RepID=A0A450W6N8_9GAMM|nr:MAG: hypothetical protein BECKLFY1418C_GA0070996_100165 [Candidatus Kentron sp. LFY]
MTPAFRIFADSSEITGAIRDRLISLSVTDEAGNHSDTVEIRLDDRDGIIELPRKGAELEVLMGYRESGLVEMGLFTVDEVELTGPPDTMVVRGKAANMRASLKAHKTRPWDETTIGDIVAAIAGEHGLEPRVADSLASVKIVHLDQTEESDLHLLTRIAKKYDAVSKPVNNFLLFVPRGEAKSATGKEIPAVSINRNETSDHRVTLADRGKYQAVLAHWHDTSTGLRTPVQVGEGEPVFTLRHAYKDANTATAAAQAKLDALMRGLGTLSLTLKHGNPVLAAEAKLTLLGFREGVDGDWVITQANHTMAGGGYSTSLGAETPKES